MQAVQPVHRDLFINGEWTKAKKGSRLEVICPTTEQIVGSIPEGTAADVEEAIEAAVKTFQGPWSKSRGHERAKFLRAIAQQVNLQLDHALQLTMVCCISHLLAGQHSLMCLKSVN